MASNLEFVNYLCEQMEGVGAIRAKKMFGEYMIYCNDRPVLIVCDDRAMVKMLPCLESLLAGRPVEPPYEGARDHYVLDPDDRETLRQTVTLAQAVIPLPKKRPKKAKGPNESLPHQK